MQINEKKSIELIELIPHNSNAKQVLANIKKFEESKIDSVICEVNYAMPFVVEFTEAIEVIKSFCLNDYKGIETLYNAVADELFYDYIGWVD
jgi:hypothetical protein